MPKQNTIVGLDIGSTKVCCAIGGYREENFEILGLAKVANTGMRRGIVADIEETVSAISACIEQTERMSGIPITSAQIGVGGSHIRSVDSKGVIAVSRPDGEITEPDIERVIEAAQAGAMPPNQEILHIIPKNFTVDGQTGIKDPIGMTGIRLEIETHVVGGSASAIKNLGKCVTRAGLDVDGLVFSPLATAKILLNKKQKEIGVAVVDIGAGTTSLAVFEEGEVVFCDVLPVGSMHITNDIAIGLRTSLEVAEEIKKKYGTPLVDKIRDSETIDLSKLDQTEQEKTPRKYVAEIIEARLTEIFSLIKDDLKKIGRDGMLPAGVVFSGGGSQLDGLIDFSKEYLRLPAQIGSPRLEISGMVDKLENPSYATSIGLMIWGMEEGNQPKSQFKLGKFDLNNFGGVVEKAKNIFKHFLP